MTVLERVQLAMKEIEALPPVQFISPTRIFIFNILILMMNLFSFNNVDANREVIEYVLYESALELLRKIMVLFFIVRGYSDFFTNGIRNPSIQC